MFIDARFEAGRRLRGLVPREIAMTAKRQRGMTTLGMLILIAFVGLFVFAGIRLVPVYLEHMKIESVLNGVVKEFDGQSPSTQDMRLYIQKRFDVESVNIIRAQDVKVKRDGESYVISAKYANTTPFLANVSFQVDFDKEVVVRR